MDISVFTDKTDIPDNKKLSEALGDLYEMWIEIRNYVYREYPLATEEWNFPGQKYGWSFRIKDKKRAIIYLLPRNQYFLVAFVFGEKATQAALAGNIADDIKNTIKSAKVYAEGRGFRIEVRNDEILADIKQLVNIKLQK